MDKKHEAKPTKLEITFSKAEYDKYLEAGVKATPASAYTRGKIPAIRDITLTRIMRVIHDVLKRGVSSRTTFRRQETETFLEWSNRVNSQGYLDEHEYRWLYQKAAFRWLISPFIRFVNFIKRKFNE